MRPTALTALPGDETALVEAAGLGDVSAAGTVVGSRRRERSADVVEVVVDGWRFELEVEDAGRAELRERATRDRADTAGSGALEVRAIIPGRVVSLVVAEGDRVGRGQPLLVLEAMKMQNELRATRDGTVGRIAAVPGATVEVGDVLLVLE